MKRVLILGAGGFLGSRIVHSLSSDFEVIAVVRGGKQELRLKNTPPPVPVVELNGKPPLEVVQAYDPWCVVYAAVEYGQGDATPTLTETNVTIPLQIAQHLGTKHEALFISFDTFYSKFDGYQHLQGYQGSKREFLAQLHTLPKTYPIANLRLEQVYGPGDSPTKTFARLVKDIVTGVPVLALTSGEQKRDFISVNDVAEAVRILALHGDDLPKGVSTIGVGTGKSVSLRSVLELVKEISQSSTQLQFGAVPYRPGEPMDSFADTTFLSSLGWTPFTSLSSGLKEML